MNFIKTYINRSFFIGLILCFGIMSKYILGPDNLIEDLAELLYKKETGKDIDFSPDLPVEKNETPESELLANSCK